MSLRLLQVFLHPQLPFCKYLLLYTVYCRSMQAQGLPAPFMPNGEFCDSIAPWSSLIPGEEAVRQKKLQVPTARQASRNLRRSRVTSATGTPIKQWWTFAELRNADRAGFDHDMLLGASLNAFHSGVWQSTGANPGYPLGCILQAVAFQQAPVTFFMLRQPGQASSTVSRKSK